MKNIGTTKSELREPIAIVGIGCRLPRGICRPKDFWRFLQSGENAFTRFPENRRHPAETSRNPKMRKDPSALPPAAYLEDVAHFDAAFFEISPREAAAMDPQQRLLLEVAWETLEDAGWTLEQVRHTRTGVFAGAMGCDYINVHQESGTLTPFSALGLDTGLIANRVSYFLGLQGPSLTVNTASSSSLVAVHLAAQSLRAGEAERALVGGVNLILNPRTTECLRQMGVLSPQAGARAFTTEADGYVRGEGVVCVALKTLSRAVRDDDRIYCLIVDSAVNNNGNNSNIAAPNRDSQIQLLEAAYARQENMVGQVRYIEAHGSGTVAGDKAELAALSSFFGTGRSEESPLLIGTVKNNIGHLEAAAGIAGLVKAALSIHHGRLPGSRIEGNLSPPLRESESRLKLLTANEEWNDPEEFRLAGVSSFGFGGTNCHVVLGAAGYAGQWADRGRAAAQRKSSVSLKKSAANEKPGRLYLIPVSARSPLALIEYAAAAAVSLESEHSDVSLGDWAYTAATRRSHHFYRKAILAASCAELSRKLSDPANHCFSGRTGEQSRAPRIVLALSGPKTGRRVFPDRFLLDHDVYRKRFEECAEAVRRETGRKLENYSARPEGDRPDSVMRALLEWAAQVSLLELTKTLGFRHQDILGDDFGAIVAEHFGGQISTSTAARKIMRAFRKDRTAETAEVGKTAERYRWLMKSPESENGREKLLLISAVDWPQSKAEPKAWLKREGLTGETIEIALQRTDKPGIAGVLTALGEIYENGGDLDWDRHYSGQPGRFLALPLYRWQRERYWLTAPAAAPDSPENGDSNGRKTETDRKETLAENISKKPRSVENGSAASVPKPGLPVWRELKDIAETDRFRAAVDEHLLNLLAASLGRRPAEIDREAPLLYLGLESLTAMDLENAIAADFRVEVALIQQLGEINLKHLGELITQQLIFLKRQSGNDFENSKGEKAINGWEIERI